MTQDVMILMRPGYAPVCCTSQVRTLTHPFGAPSLCGEEKALDSGLRRNDEQNRGANARSAYMFRRYSPPTSYSAWLIWPSEWVFTASISAAKTFLRSR